MINKIIDARNILAAAIISRLRPIDRRLPTDWAEENVFIEHSEQQQGLFDKTYAPYLNFFIDAVVDPSIKIIIMLKPVQSGGTQLLEIIYVWSVANWPRPAILTGQTDKDMEGIFEDKILRSLRASPATRSIIENLPADAIRIDKARIPGMPTEIQGPGGNKIHSKTKGILFCDEMWLWGQGIFNKLLKRTDAAKGAKIVGVSQAGKQIGTDDNGNPIYDDLCTIYHLGTMHEREVKCPSCSDYFSLETEHIIWSREAQNPQTKRWDMKKIAETIRLKCPCCKVEHDPGKTKDEREAWVRKLSNTGRYRQTNPHARSGVLTGRYSVWNVFWKDWVEMVEEYLFAKKMWRQGVTSYYQDWVQQREARPWLLEYAETPSNKELFDYGYKLGAYASGETIPDEYLRFAGIDFQSRDLKMVIRAFKKGGDSRLVYYGTPKTFAEAASILARYRVIPKYTVLDAHNWTQEAYKECAARGWVALHGSGTNSWTHAESKKSKVREPFSPVIKGRVTSTVDKFCWYYEWSNLYFKDWLSRLIARQGLAWEYPNDVNEEYIEAMDSEERRTNKQGEPKWEKIGKRRNHLWDAECMILARVRIFGKVFDMVPIAEPEEAETVTATA